MAEDTGIDGKILLSEPSSKAVNLTTIDPKVQNEFDRLDKIVVGIVTVLTLAFITLLITVIGMVIDSQRFNATLYKEYSNKIQTNEVLLEANRELLNIILRSNEVSTSTISN